MPIQKSGSGGDAVPDGDSEIHESTCPERLEHGVVERTARCQVGALDSKVVKHRHIIPARTSVSNDVVVSGRHALDRHVVSWGSAGCGCVGVVG